MNAGGTTPGRWGRLRRERTLHAFLLALGALLAIGVLRPANISGASPNSFWKTKMTWSRCADLVLGGDSRTYTSVSPVIMARSLPSLRILNFGFDNAGFSREYLAALEGVLDSTSGRRIIVLGITPHSLTQGTGGRFVARKSRLNKRPAFLRRAGGLRTTWFANLTAAVPLNHAFLFLTGSRRLPRHEGVYHRDGWLAARLTPEQPNQGFEVARRWYVNNRVDPALAEGVISQTRRWTNQGIRVYGFRPPTVPEMVRLEDELGGFKEADFVREFTEAGGRWLRMDQTSYHTYDSSHLDRDAAADFSDDLARAIGVEGEN